MKLFEAKWIALVYHILLLGQKYTIALREFRSYSVRAACPMAQDANYPFAYSKYLLQTLENKGRVNSNLQDFRHECFVLGGRSKCHICEEIQCESDLNTCQLQLQGVNFSDVSTNIPVVSDTAWAVGGNFKHDYGGVNVSRFCVFTSGGSCLNPYNTDFSSCTTRCFGDGFKGPAKKNIVLSRSIEDIYPGMGRWVDDGQVDLWSYPSDCVDLNGNTGISCAHSGPFNDIPSYNPQGYSLNIAGSGSIGFKDGASQSASFNYPEDVAIDEYGVIYVADTKNNAIRAITKDRVVKTLAGRGPKKAGFKDGLCNVATFALPKGLDVRHETINAKLTTVIIVADTGNHRIRRIEIDVSSGYCTVKCLTGLCGNNSLSALLFAEGKSAPLSGYADGNGLEARFSAPESVAFMEGNYFVVADTGNALIRWVVASNGSTSTLAGNVVHGETDENGTPLPGCAPPCLVGKKGFRDGNLTYAQFYNPLDVTRGENNSVWVVDEQRTRIIELPNVITDLYTIHSMGRVSTIAGTSLQGHDDGIGQKSNFFYSSGIFVTKDNIAYVADSASCRIRRITPMPLVAETLTCNTKGYEVIRPSGCTSFDQPIDKIGRKVSRVERNIQYNFGSPYENDLDRGKYIKNCVGVPPRDKLDKRFVFKTGDNLVVDDLRTVVNEDSEQGIAVVVQCPSGCSSNSYASTTVLQGTMWYSDLSSVCRAAIHSGIISNVGGIIQIMFERTDYLNNQSTIFSKGTLQNQLQSTSIQNDTYRVFSIVHLNYSNSMVHTIAGHPSAPLESACGYHEAQPSTRAFFNNPSGVAANYNESLTDKTYLYIADTNNHRIRAISATCTQICENGAKCVGPDTCKCLAGWQGVDCTKPVCSSVCGTNKLCVGPNTCGCKPGYRGANCDVAQCVQKCHNGGLCSAPDTCSCATGWFDSNCTTPVCSQTCANGGNCTAPNKCSCPQQWSGKDCRIPVCSQICLNGGFCVAPNTCICSPQWTNYDCSAPVCHQGYFVPTSARTNLNDLFTISLIASPTYKNCDLESWCNATHEFECDQQDIGRTVIEVPFGPKYRALTGRKRSPTQCMNIELPLNYKIPFQLLHSDNSTTGNVRYSPNSPYTSNAANAWQGYTQPTAGHTGPWAYTPDRQVPYVNWLNISQGNYVCANGGKSVNPDLCSCADGWIGFDCRTPVCTQGYYKAKQTKYVSGKESAYEVNRFEPFMGENSYRLQWPYSNPNFTIQFENYTSSNNVVRNIHHFNGIRYYGPQDISSGKFKPTYQGGYRCSIRSSTQWEHEGYVFSHPNFYSRYMNRRVQTDGKNYTFWVGLDWPPTHRKSRVLDQEAFNLSFSYTNEGFRRRGIWNRTENAWQFGVCIVQFYRNCSGDVNKQFDVQSKLHGVYVQDTDLSFRPRIFYDDLKVSQLGRWKEAGGSCVDNVMRGCANNGTCIAPNTCRCATGWKGYGCNIPICEQTCYHHGNCTDPNICTCERGWKGFDCSIPICAQECQNSGYCIAPDVCKCLQWTSGFTDARQAGGRPSFQDENGDALKTGWTGYDCSVPICVQAESFVLNVPNIKSNGFVALGGHGANGLMKCESSYGDPLPRCPLYSASSSFYVTSNDGSVFQSGCGFDPFDTGCCRLFPAKKVICYKCAENLVQQTNNTFYCAGTYTVLIGTTDETEKFADFVDIYKNFKLCGDYHKPRDYTGSTYGVAQYYFNVLSHYESSFNFRSNYTSNRFLCNAQQWIQGDYIDDAGLGSISGVGSVYGLDSGRSVRINTPNIFKNQLTQIFKRGPKIRGEGLYKCYNKGSCIAPDVCTCNDGYDGFDCKTPLCRHLQPTGKVTSCLNGGNCVSRDTCVCIQTQSVLWLVHPEASKGLTGWTGSDCSIPMCMQGYYDPFCSDLPQAPAGEGCYRCANGGNCTAPEICKCAPGWTGYDCKTPTCEVVADPLTRIQLNTVYEEKIVSFESDPCGVTAIYGLKGYHGRKYARGNCTKPNQCTCLCKIPYDKKYCKTLNRLCSGAWQDKMVGLRNLLISHGPEYTFGSTSCKYGYEGNVDSLDRWTTCHQTIYVPTQTEKDSLTLIISISICGFFILVFYRFASGRLKRRFLIAKIERRRQRRSSEESLIKVGAFANS